MSINMDYQQTLDYIYGFVNYETLPMPRGAGHFDLRRMDELMLELGNPHLAAKSVHIAGTKGKGSTAAMIASVLTASGYNTGLYTSPHLIDLRERIRVNGVFISEQELITLTQKCQPEIEVVNQRATFGKLTTFEVLTALAFAYFKLKGVDFQVLEVGLGGRLDATNIVYPQVCLITHIGYDHMEVLGNTLAAIAGEKAGIIKPGCVAVSSPQADEAGRVIEEVCRERGVRLIVVGRDVTWQGLSFDLNGQLLEVKGRLGSYRLSIPLLGEFQLENTATAVAALEVLAENGFNISADSITDGLAWVSWPGRLQVLSHHPLLVVDGAHNPDSARRLGQSLKRHFDFDRAALVMGASLDKDITAVVSELFPLFDSVIVTRSQHPRAMAPAKLKAEFARHGVEAEIAADVPTALSRVVSAVSDRDIICVAGSLFVVAEAIEWANQRGL